MLLENANEEERAEMLATLDAPIAGVTPPEVEAVLQEEFDDNLLSMLGMTREQAVSQARLNQVDS